MACSTRGCTRLGPGPSKSLGGGVNAPQAADLECVTGVSDIGDSGSKPSAVEITRASITKAPLVSPQASFRRLPGRAGSLDSPEGGH